MGRKPDSAQLPLPVRYQQDARRTVAVTVGEGSSSVAPCEIAPIADSAVCPERRLVTM
jgi:hypothetical protein